MMKMHANEGIEMLKRYCIHPDIVFISCEKNTGNLVSLIESIAHNFKDCIIVGDDLIFETVKKAIQQLKKKITPFKIFEDSEAYLLLPGRYANIDNVMEVYHNLELWSKTKQS
jgi:hypothetical protein